MALFGFAIVGEHGEVEEGGAVIGFDHDGDVADAGEHAFLFDDWVHVYCLSEKYGE